MCNLSLEILNLYLHSKYFSYRCHCDGGKVSVWRWRDENTKGKKYKILMKTALKSLSNFAYKTQIHFYTVKMQKWFVIPQDFEIHKHSWSKKKKKKVFFFCYLFARIIKRNQDCISPKHPKSITCASGYWDLLRLAKLMGNPAQFVWVLKGNKGTELLITGLMTLLNKL